MGKMRRRGSGQYLDSITTAEHCYLLVEEYAAGVRPPTLSWAEVVASFDVPISRLPKELTRRRKRHVLDIWEYAQWVRIRDVVRWSGVNKSALWRMKSAGYLRYESKYWFTYESEAMTYKDALYVQKYMLLRPFLKRCLGAADRWDVDTLSILPLGTLLGIITNRGLAQQLCTVYGYER